MFKNMMHYLLTLFVIGYNTVILSQEPCVVPVTPTVFEPMFQNPEAPAVAFFPNPNVSNALVPPPQTIGLTFLAEDDRKHLYFRTPPDTMGVVGPKQFIMALNTRVSSFDKKTGKMDFVLDSTPSLFGDNIFLDEEGIARAKTTGDPTIQYDPLSKRWFVLYLSTPGIGFGNTINGGFFLAVSDGCTIDASTRWTTVDIANNTLVRDPNGCIGDVDTFFDFPHMGIDVHAVYISAYIFSETGLANTLFVIPKKDLLCGKPPKITAFRDISGFTDNPTFYLATAMPATNSDVDAKFGYIVQGPPFELGKLNVWRVVDPGTDSPSLVGPFPLTVPTTSVPSILSGGVVSIPSAGNLYGRTGLLENVTPGAPTQPHIRKGQLYTTQSVVVNKNGVALFDEATQMPLGDRVGIRWYQIDLTGDSSGNARNKKFELSTTMPALVQAGTIFDDRNTSTPLYYWMSTMNVNKRGDIVVSGTVSSEVTYPKAFYVGRLKTDPLGTMHIGSGREGGVFATGSGNYATWLNARFFPIAFSVGQRWGDYSMVSVDPDDEMTFWSIQEIYQGAKEQCWVARLDSPKKLCKKKKRK